MNCKACCGYGWIHGPEAGFHAGKERQSAGYRRYMCAACRGAGRRRTVEIGPGTVSGPVDDLSREQRHDISMLAACLGAREWPPEGA